MKLRVLLATALLASAVALSSCSKSPVDEICDLADDYTVALRENDTEKAQEIAEKMDKTMEGINQDDLSDDDRAKIQKAMLKIISAEFDSYQQAPAE